MAAIVRSIAVTLCAGVLLCAPADLAHTPSTCMSPLQSNDQWQIAAPESVGIDGGKLCVLVPRFQEWKEANLHGVVVVRHRKLAFEHYFRGYDLKARNGPGTIDFDWTTSHD